MPFRRCNWYSRLAMRQAGKTTASETVGGESRKEPRPNDHHTSVENGRYGCDEQGDDDGPASISLRCSANSIPGDRTDSTYCEDDGGDHSDGDLVGHVIQRIRSTNEVPPEVPFSGIDYLRRSPVHARPLMPENGTSRASPSRGSRARLGRPRRRGRVARPACPGAADLQAVTRLGW